MIGEKILKIMSEIKAIEKTELDVENKTSNTGPAIIIQSVDILQYWGVTIE